MNVNALQEFFWHESQRPQKFGVVDCVQFVTEAVWVGWCRDFRNVLGYYDRASAVQRLRELGGLKAACDFAMGERFPVEELEPGDVVWFDEPKTLGLLMPGYVAVKLGTRIDRYRIEPGMIGWKTSGR